MVRPCSCPARDTLCSGGQMLSMSQMGQSRRFGHWPTTSGLPLETDIVRAHDYRRLRYLRAIGSARKASPTVSGEGYFRCWNEADPRAPPQCRLVEVSGHHSAERPEVSLVNERGTPIVLPCRQTTSQSSILPASGTSLISNRLGKKSTTSTTSSAPDRDRLLRRHSCSSDHGR